MAEWLSSCALLQRPRVSLVWILGVDLALSSNQAEVVSHMPQLEGPTTKKKYTTMYWGDLGERKKKKRRLASLAQVPIFKKQKNPKTPGPVIVTGELHQVLKVVMISVLK